MKNPSFVLLIVSIALLFSGFIFIKSVQSEVLMRMIFSGTGFLVFSVFFVLIVRQVYFLNNK